jgi:hypothetical protein
VYCAYRAGIGRTFREEHSADSRSSDGLENGQLNADLELWPGPKLGEQRVQRSRPCKSAHLHAPFRRSGRHCGRDDRGDFILYGSRGAVASRRAWRAPVGGRWCIFRCELPKQGRTSRLDWLDVLHSGASRPFAHSGYERLDHNASDRRYRPGGARLAVCVEQGHSGNEDALFPRLRCCWCFLLGRLATAQRREGVGAARGCLWCTRQERPNVTVPKLNTALAALNAHNSQQQVAEQGA